MPADAIEIVDSDTAWGTAFATEARLIRDTHVPHPDDIHYPFLHRPAEWPHTHHIHVCEAGSQTERKHLAFRDFLREHPDSARQYEDLKYQLAAQHSAATFESRNAYADAKSSFIEPLIERALAAGYPREPLASKPQR